MRVRLKAIPSHPQVVLLFPARPPSAHGLANRWGQYPENSFICNFFRIQPFHQPRNAFCPAICVVVLSSWKQAAAIFHGLVQFAFGLLKQHQQSAS
jgi:hypothetical protein